MWEDGLIIPQNLFSHSSFPLLPEQDQGNGKQIQLQACKEATFSLLLWERTAAQFGVHVVHSIIEGCISASPLQMIQRRSHLDRQTKATASETGKGEENFGQASVSHESTVRLCVCVCVCVCMCREGEEQCGRKEKGTQTAEVAAQTHSEGVSTFL